MFYVIERSTKEGGANVPKRVAVNEDIEQAMKKLGMLIKECRGELSLRKVAMPCGIPASQLMSIENGVMAPTAEVYSKLLALLKPGNKKKEMDSLFMTIRQIPPPDICARVMRDENLMNVIREMDDAPLTEVQSVKLIALLSEFRREHKKGD